jgi:hypothetical protein
MLNNLNRTTKSSVSFVSYYLAHLEELLLHYDNLVLQAKYFGVMLNNAPDYNEIILGTPDRRKVTGVNKVFYLNLSTQDSWLAIMFCVKPLLLNSPFFKIRFLTC